MTVADAHQIQLALIEYEFPRVFSSSAFFALFKTYGVPSISKLLASTGQLADETTASKRAADTGIILTEVIMNQPRSSRNIDGIARMNYLHGRHRKAGKISDEDMLYTLSLFALEPLRWTSCYEWRAVTSVERCATGTYWKDMGDSMAIPFSALPSFKIGWQDGLHFLEELETWSLAYEESHMAPDPTNKKLAEATLDIALFNLPYCLKGVGRNFIVALLKPRLRKAMMFDEPAAFYNITLRTMVNTRKLLIRYLSLPRPYFMRAQWNSNNADPKTGCYHTLRYVSHPWYVEPTLAARWGPSSWTMRLLGGNVPGDAQEKYFPQGYHITELGPEKLKGCGTSAMEETKKELLKRKALACPFLV
ncbi:hypothetical protein MMC25_001115 [Agyrium rufum]|nr:hypothetical protein [Agyrium rufum]